MDILSAPTVSRFSAPMLRAVEYRWVERLPAIYIGDHLYLVIGILRDVVRKPELLGSVIIREGTARRYFGLFGPAWSSSRRRSAPLP
jgi:hypothetical protein